MIHKKLIIPGGAFHFVFVACGDDATTANDTLIHSNGPGGKGDHFGNTGASVSYYAFSRIT